MSKTLKFLFIGNSFAVDTMEHFANVALSMGYEKVKLWTLYIGGCSINKHYNNLKNNLSDYTCFINEGDGWKEDNNYNIKDSIQSDTWDYIAIQHGTNDLSRYSNIKSYENLENLVKEIKNIANKDTKIIFNMTWVGEPSFPHEEILAFNKDTTKLFNAIVNLTKTYILPIKDIDIVCPTGIAIDNARKEFDELLTRDGYHLSLSLGRYIASLTMFKAITNKDITDLTWFAKNVNISDKNKIINIVNKSSF